MWVAMVETSGIHSFERIPAAVEIAQQRGSDCASPILLKARLTLLNVQRELTAAFWLPC